MLVRILPLLAAALLSIAPLPAHAAIRARLLGAGFNRPIALVFDPVVPGAVHLVQQDGLVLTFVNGVQRPTPFLDLRSVVSGGADERGLLGMAFPPDAVASGRVFVNFTNRTGAGNTVIARFTRSVADPLVVNTASRLDLQWPAGGAARQGFITQPFSNHNGGNMVFGPDGYLYIGMGDGGSGDDPDNNAQTGTTLLGKMLRIDVSGSPANGYAVPPTNPAFSVTALPEIWSFGLRNPWRYSFDDFGTGATNALVVADVGQGAREEIDFEPANQGGRNYGWHFFEGSIDNPNMQAGGPAFFPVTSPIFDYSHAVGQAITGGYVYRGNTLGAAYQGRYFYADCVAGKVWSLQLNVDPGTGEATASNNTDHSAELGGPFNCVASFARDSAGELYFLDFDYLTGGAGTGRVFKIETTGASAPGTPSGLSANVQGNAVTLNWTAPAGGSATGYLMEAGSAPGAANVGSVSTAATALFFPGVPNGRYYVRVKATNAAGASAPTSDLIVDVGCAGPPAAPTTLNTSVSGTVVSISWNVAPGAATTVFEAANLTGPIIYTQSFAAPSAGFAVSAPPGSYRVRVRAVNACGSSVPSVERTVVVP